MLQKGLLDIHEYLVQANMIAIHDGASTLCVSCLKRQWVWGRAMTPGYEVLSEGGRKVCDQVE